MKHLKYFGTGLLALVGISLCVAVFYLAISFIILAAAYVVTNLWQALLIGIVIGVAYALGKTILTPPQPAYKKKGGLI